MYLQNKKVCQKTHIMKNFLSNPLKQMLLVIKTGGIVYAKKTENK